jgi:hypothetical protein
MNYRKLFAQKLANEARIKKLCPDITSESGIYVFSRVDEKGIKFAYVGQAKNLLQRTADHLNGYSQHIDLSLKKHGLFDAEKNPYGWKLVFALAPECGLDAAEKAFILSYHQNGFQLHNETLGGQGEGKELIISKPRKGYLQGKIDGYTKAYKEIAELIAKYTTGLTSKGGAVADRKTDELIKRLNQSRAEEE